MHATHPYPPRLVMASVTALVAAVMTLALATRLGDVSSHAAPTVSDVPRAAQLVSAPASAAPSSTPARVRPPAWVTSPFASIATAPIKLPWLRPQPARAGS